MEFTLLFAALTAVGLLWLGTRLWSERLPDKPLDDLIGAAVIGLFTGRLAAMLAQGLNPITNVTDFIIVRGGVDTGAASVAAIASLAWMSRHRLGDLDALAPASLLGLAGWHAGCLWRGACLGAASDLPWAWSGPMTDVTRHPVELYAAVGLAFSAWIVGRLGWRPFTRAGSALALAGLIRLVTQPMRPSLYGGPIEWYLAGLLVGVAAALFGTRLSRRISPATPT